MLAIYLMHPGRTDKLELEPQAKRFLLKDTLSAKAGPMSGPKII